jgi:TAT (twin-arginine translocation) pathway signal sequence
MSPGPPSPLSRRRFLLGTGAAAGAVLLGGCGGDEVASGGDPTTTTTSLPSGDLSLVQFFGGLPMLVAGGEVRAPFGLADTEDLLPVERTPEVLTVTVSGPDGNDVAAPFEVPRHAEGLPSAYFPLRFTAGDPGIYTGRTEVDGAALEMAIKIDAAEDVQVLQVGAAMPAIATPTTDDARGVDPICTADPVCALHAVTVADALATGRPLGLLVATPAFCQITICGPVLDVLLAVGPDHPAVQLLHAEVYAHPQESLDAQTAAVGELGLTFEPCLVLVGSDGRVAERLDTIFDEAEVSEALARLT